MPGVLRKALDGVVRAGFHGRCLFETGNGICGLDLSDATGVEVLGAVPAMHTTGVAAGSAAFISWVGGSDDLSMGSVSISTPPLVPRALEVSTAMLVLGVACQSRACDAYAPQATLARLARLRSASGESTLTAIGSPAAARTGGRLARSRYWALQRLAFSTALKLMLFQHLAAPLIRKTESTAPTPPSGFYRLTDARRVANVCRSALSPGYSIGLQLSTLCLLQIAALQVEHSLTHCIGLRVRLPPA